MNNKPTLWIMVGLPGSGKSTFASRYVENHISTVHISRDKIRFSIISDNDEYFALEYKVFEEFCTQIQSALDMGFNVIADATHLNWKSRAKLIHHLQLKNVYVGCIFINTPVEICIERNSTREGRAHVPEDVIMTMNKSITNPQTDPFIYKEIKIFNEEIKGDD